jgi:hypothetical protein
MIIIVQYMDMGNSGTKDNFKRAYHYIREIRPHSDCWLGGVGGSASGRKLGLSLPGFAFEIAKSGASSGKGNVMRPDVHLERPLNLVTVRAYIGGRRQQKPSLTFIQSIECTCCGHTAKKYESASRSKLEESKVIIACKYFSTLDPQLKVNH